MRTPRSAKVALAFAAGYILFGRDLVPDDLPLVGGLDDFVVVVLALAVLLMGGGLTGYLGRCLKFPERAGLLAASAGLTVLCTRPELLGHPVAGGVSVVLAAVLCGRMFFARTRGGEDSQVGCQS